MNGVSVGHGQLGPFYTDIKRAAGDYPLVVDISLFYTLDDLTALQANQVDIKLPCNLKSCAFLALMIC